MNIRKGNFSFDIIKSLSSVRMPILTDECCYYDKTIHNCCTGKVVGLYAITRNSDIADIFFVVKNENGGEKVITDNYTIYPISEKLKMVKGLMFSKEFNVKDFKLDCEYKSVKIPYMLKIALHNGNSIKDLAMITEFNTNFEVTNIFITVKSYASSLFSVKRSIEFLEDAKNTFTTKVASHNCISVL